MSHQLYQQMILDHSRSPRGFDENPKGLCEDAHNPLCGDKIKLCVSVQDGRLEKVCFWGEGCSLSIASASILVDVTKGMSLSEFKDLGKAFLNMFKGEAVSLPEKLNVFSGVLEYPMRVKCVTMVWHAALKAVDNPKPYPIILSDKCIAYWNKLIKVQGGQGILLEFKQLGCYGWQFLPSVQMQVLEDKEVFDYNGLRLWIDAALIAKVSGTSVDYVDDDFGHRVVFQHPKAKQHCGCGESFVIEDKDE